MNCETVERDNIIERYVAGKLEPPLKEEWEEHYFGCDACARELETCLAIAGPLRERADEMPTRRGASRVWLWRGAAIAAALLVTAGVWMTMRSGARAPETVRSERPGQSSEIAELARLDPPAYDPGNVRGAESKAEQQFVQAMQLYRGRDFAGAIPGLRVALETDPRAAAPRFFLGACYLLTGDSADGIRELQTVATGDSPFVEEARFDLAKGYLAAGRRQEALDTMRQVAGGSGDLRESAQRFVDRLSAIR